MAEYEKPRHFSGGWMIGGAVIIFLTNFFGGFVAGAAGVSSIDTIVVIAVACFALGGFVIGWKSEGQTIIEAGLAAIIAILVALTIRGQLGAVAHLDATTLLYGFGIPFASAVAGAFVGEKVQGDVIRTSDD